MVAQLNYDYVRTRPTKALSRLVSYGLFEGRPATTRGRWINSLVFAHFALEQRLPQLKRVRKPIFILGMGRTGTTALGVVMSMHRSVGFLNEPKALWHRICPYEDVIGNYTLGAARYHLDRGDADPDSARTAHRLVGAYLAVVFASRLVDKYPELVFRVPYVRTIFPDAKLILLVRNGWDTCTSIRNWSENHRRIADAKREDWWGVDGRKWRLLQSQLVPADPQLAGLQGVISRLDNDRDRAVVEWIVTMREGLRRTAEQSSGLLTVRYEDLVSSPRPTLQRIADFSELCHDDTFLRYGVKALRPTGGRGEFPLKASLRAPFLDTMRALGY